MQNASVTGINGNKNTGIQITAPNIKLDDGQYGISLTKVAYHDSSIRLSGAKFRVTISDGSRSTTLTKTTSGSGILGITKSDSSILNLTEGSEGKTITITIKETEAPDGYMFEEGTITIRRNSWNKQNGKDMEI